MYFVARIIGDLCCGMPQPDVENKKLNNAARMSVATIAGDALVSITSLVIGILGVLSIIHGVPPAASYFLISLGGTIALSWIIFSICSRGKILSEAKEYITTALSSDPKIRMIK